MCETDLVLSADPCSSTAIVSLTHHPVLQQSLHGKTSAGGPEEPAGRIELIATARERRNFGGFDSQGKAIGRNN